MYSSGSAAQENSAYMESLQAKITNLKATYENIVLGDGGISDFAKKLLDSANSILKFIDYGNNLQAMLSGVLGILITIKSQNIATTILSTYSSVVKLGQGIKALTTGNVIVNVFNAARNAINTYRSSIIAGTTATQAASAAMNTLKLSMSGIAAGVGIAITAISLITQAVNSYKQKQEEAAEETRQQLKDYSSTSEQYSSLRESLTKTTLTQEEFNSILKAAPDIFGDYRGEVKLTKESLDEYIKKLDEASAKQARTTFTSSIGEARSAAERLSDPSSYVSGETSRSIDAFSTETGKYSFADTGRFGNVTKYIDQANAAKSTEEYVAALQKAQVEAEKYRQSQSSVSDASAYLSTITTDLGKAIKEASEGSEDDITTLRGQIDAYNDANGSLSAYSKEVENYKNILGDTEPAQKETTKTVAEMAAELGLTEKQFTDFAKSQKMSTDEAYNWISVAQKSTKNAKSMADTLSDLNSDLDLATKAYKEYNENGAVNADTLQKLLSLEPEYLSALIDSNGQININSQSLQDMAKLMKNAAIADLQDAAAKDVLAIATGKTTELSGLAQGAIDGMNGKIGDTSKYAQVAAGDMAGFTASIYAAASASQGKKLDVASLTKDQQKEINAVVGSYYSVAKSFSKISIATTTNTKATHRNTSATNKNTTAKERNRKKNKELSEEIDKQTKKLEKQKDKLQDNIDAWNDQAEEMEKLFSIVIDRIEEKIDKLQEKNDKYQEKIDARTEKFEKAKEKEEKALDKKIDAIDKEIAAQQEANDAVDDAIELQEKLENLRKAQSTKVKVFKDGQWTWGTDQAAVDEAQKELDEYNRAKAQENAIAELERAKELLETQKDSLDAKYEALIANDKLINKWQSIIDKNNEEIALLEKQKKEVEDISKMYERMEENAILKKYLDTDKIFGTKGLKHSVIPALQKVENEYINIQDYIKDAEEEVKRFEKAISGLNDLSSQVGNSEGSISGGWVQRQIDKWLNKLNPKRKSKKKKKKKKHASGVANVANDEIALVGESPYEEMIIGSKYNTGTVVQLSKGSGVVNAAATNTLAGILNTFAKSNFGAGNGVLNNNNRDLSTIINISNLNVETQNGEQFVNYLQDFAMKMRQESYKNK